MNIPWKSQQPQSPEELPAWHSPTSRFRSRLVPEQIERVSSSCGKTRVWARPPPAGSKSLTGPISVSYRWAPPSSPSMPGSLGPLPSLSLQRLFLGEPGLPVHSMKMGLGPGARRPEGFELSPASYQRRNSRWATSRLRISWVDSSFLKELAEDREGSQPWRHSTASRIESACCQQAARITVALTWCLISILSCQMNLHLPGLASILFSKADHHRGQEPSLHTPPARGPWVPPATMYGVAPGSEPSVQLCAGGRNGFHALKDI